jgi:hypothetical protein
VVTAHIRRRAGTIGAGEGDYSGGHDWVAIKTVSAGYKNLSLEKWHSAPGRQG